jgi:hypothetical protein
MKVSGPAGRNPDWGNRQSRTQLSAGRSQAVFQAVKRSGAREKKEKNRRSERDAGNLPVVTFEVPD